MVQRRNLIAHTHVSNLGVGEDRDSDSLGLRFTL